MGRIIDPWAKVGQVACSCVTLGPGLELGPPLAIVGSIFSGVKLHNVGISTLTGHNMFVRHAVCQSPHVDGGVGFTLLFSAEMEIQCD